MFVRTKVGWFECLNSERGFGDVDPATGKEMSFTLIDASVNDLPYGGHTWKGRGPASRAVERCAGERILECVL
jgi:hypothetical protein